ncbi:MAG: hypothetical protein JST92_26520 [Deltaproteobacteria bacterium]|nr:hypothetical protein [Deltaproteobacteria bacterium]
MAIFNSLLDIGTIRTIASHGDAFISFDLWVNKSLSFRGAEIRFGDPDKAEPDLSFPWLSTHHDIAAIAWDLFPWLSLDEYHSLNDHSGEVEEHVLACSLNAAAQAFLVLEDFFESQADAPPLPDAPPVDDDTYWSEGQWDDDN